MALKCQEIFFSPKSRSIASLNARKDLIYIPRERFTINYMSNIYICFFKTPWGILQVEHNEHFVYRSLFTKNLGTSANHSLSKLIETELSSYFESPHHRFQLPLKPQGSTHQLKVLNELLVIPVGRTLTYGELAMKIQSSPRAVGQACKNNPLALFIPCHRIVGKNNLGGYMGQEGAISYKIALLKHESSPIKSA